MWAIAGDWNLGSNELAAELETCPDKYGPFSMFQDPAVNEDVSSGGRRCRDFVVCSRPAVQISVLGDNVEAHDKAHTVVGVIASDPWVKRRAKTEQPLPQEEADTEKAEEILTRCEQHHEEWREQKEAEDKLQEVKAEDLEGWNQRVSALCPNEQQILDMTRAEANVTFTFSDMNPQHPQPHRASFLR